MFKLFLLLITLLLISCSDDSSTTSSNGGGGSGGSNSVQIVEGTEVVDQSTRESILTFTDNEIKFFQSTPQIEAIDVGDIVVDQPSDIAEYGYLRKVTSKEVDQFGFITLSTIRASLSEVIETGLIDTNWTLTEDKLKSITPEEGVQFLGSSKSFNFNFDISKTVEGSDYLAQFDGELSCDLDLNFKLNMFFLDVEYFKVSVDIDQSSNASIYCSGNSSIEKSVKIATMNFNPWVFYISFIPVVITPKIELYLNIDGTITAEATASASQSYAQEFGLEYPDDYWNLINDISGDFDFSTPSLNGVVDLEATIGPKFYLMLYGVAGFHAGIYGGAYIEGEFNSGKDRDSHIEVGAKVEVDAGVAIDVILSDLSYSAPLLNERYKLAEWPDNSGNMPDPIINIKPIGNSGNLILGENLEIDIFYGGEQPQSIDIYLDQDLLTTISQPPYNYTMDSGSMELGDYTIKAVAHYTDYPDFEDNSQFSIVEPTWYLHTLTDYEDYDFRGVWFYDSDTGYICGDKPQSQIILKTDDGGKTWKEVFSKNQQFLGSLKGITFLNEDRGYVYGDEALFETDDGGETWTDIFGYLTSQIDQYPHQIFDCDFNSNGDIILTYGMGYIFSYDYGMTWYDGPIPDLPGGVDLYKTKFIGDHGYTITLSGAEQGYFLRTTDGGFNWEVEDYQYFTPYGIDFIDSDSGIVAGGFGNYNQFIQKTDNGGDSWSELIDEQKFWLRDLTYVDDQTIFGCGVSSNTQHQGFYGLLVYSKDGGENWFEVETDYAQELKDIHFVGKYHGWAVGEDGTLFIYGTP